MSWPGKLALDAHTDQALAQMREARRAGTFDAVAGLGGELAAMIAGQFPGQEELAGRILMSAATALTSYDMAITARGLTVRPAALINLLGFTAEALTRDGEDL